MRNWGLDPGLTNLVRSFLNSRLSLITKPLLLSINRRSMRMGIWWQVQPIRRGLIDATIAYLSRGFVIRSSYLAQMVRDVLLELMVMIVSRNLRFLAYVVGSRLMGRLSRYINVARSVDHVIALGIQWLGTPTPYRVSINS